MDPPQPRVYGIGNPLIDILVDVEDHDLSLLGLHKGTMHLISSDRRMELLDFIDGKPVSYRCGGSCPNTMITLSACGIPSAIAGMVGNDRFGSIYRKNLQSLKVSDALKSFDAPTGSSIILVTPDCERTMNTYLGANRYFSPEDVDEATLAGSDLFHFTGYMWDTENQKQAIMKGMSIAHRSGTRISFDIADPFAVSRNREAFLSIITDHADVVFANSEEARILFDRYDPYECAKSLGRRCRIGVVKAGRNGSYIASEDKILRIPAYPCTPVDTTGAGDIYASGFLYSLMHGFTLGVCGRIASYLASQIIEEHGAQFSLDSLEKIKKILEKETWN